MSLTMSVSYQRTDQPHHLAAIATRSMLFQCLDPQLLPHNAPALHGTLWGQSAASSGAESHRPSHIVRCVLEGLTWMLKPPLPQRADHEGGRSLSSHVLCSSDWTWRAPLHLSTHLRGVGLKSIQPMMRWLEWDRGKERGVCVCGNSDGRGCFYWMDGGLKRDDQLSWCIAFSRKISGKRWMSAPYRQIVQLEDWLPHCSLHNSL